MKQSTEDYIDELETRLRKSSATNASLSSRLTSEHNRCRKLESRIEELEDENLVIRGTIKPIRESLNSLTAENSKLLRKIRRAENRNF